MLGIYLVYVEKYAISILYLNESSTGSISRWRIFRVYVERMPMNKHGTGRKGGNGNEVLTPPTFSPPPEMRAAYLEQRKTELESLLDHAQASEWKPVIAVANHVRGSGEMYGFKNIGEAAESLFRAIQNGDANSLGFLKTYATTVSESYV